MKAINTIYTTCFKNFLEKHGISPNQLLRKVLALQSLQQCKTSLVSASV